MNRRGFFGLFAAAAATAIAAPELELLVPTRTIFLPPAGGWIGRGNQLLTIKMISEEMMCVFSRNMEFMSEIDREYAAEFGQRDLFKAPANGRIVVRRPPRYELHVGDKLTIGGVEWPS